MKFRFRYRAAGGHVHIRVFGGDYAMYGKCGDLRMLPAEWEVFKESFRPGSCVEFMHEEEHLETGASI